jgi:hypothetical protein
VKHCRQHESGRHDAPTAKPFAFILFHPDYTVGPGVTPDLLTLPAKAEKRSRAIPPVGNCTPP